MTEYWVSQGNKWCDFCKIFISNNTNSVRTHELGTRHKENVAKRIAGIRKENVEKEKEKQMALKDMQKIEAQAKKSYERDLAKMQTSAAGPEFGPSNKPPVAKNSPAPKSVSSASRLGKPGKGVASSLAVRGKKRVEKPGSNSSEEAAALAARENARKRVKEREESLMGLYGH